MGAWFAKNLQDYAFHAKIHSIPPSQDIEVLTMKKHFYCANTIGKSQWKNGKQKKQDWIQIITN